MAAIMQNKVIPITAQAQKLKQRLRYSTLETLNTCERKFQLDNLLSGAEIREESEHLSFGSAYGVGCQSYLIYQDQDKAIFDAYLAYWPIVESEKKNEELMIAGLMASFSKLDDLLLDYEVLYVNGKPAAELTLRMEIDEDYYFTGAVDIVLKHKYSGVHYVMDFKTTGLQLFDLSPNYANSSQLIGYSIALDALLGEKQTSYGVIYFILQMGKTPGNFKIQVLDIEKNLLDRLNWFLTLRMDVERLKQMESLQMYPKRGANCLHFMRPCKYFGTCGLHSADVPKKREEDETEYDLNFDMDELIQDHINRVQTMETIL